MFLVSLEISEIFPVELAILISLKHFKNPPLVNVSLISPLN